MKVLYDILFTDNSGDRRRTRGDDDTKKRRKVLYFPVSLRHEDVAAFSRNFWKFRLHENFREYSRQLKTINQSRDIRVPSRYYY